MTVETSAHEPGGDRGLAPSTVPRAPAGTPLDEYKVLGDDLRHFGILRLYRLTLLLGTTGAMIGALSSESLRANPLVFDAVKLGGLVVAMTFTIMDYRSGEAWLRLQNRSNALAEVLGFQVRPTSPGWHPLTTTGASRLLHLFVVACWAFFVILPVVRD